ncbi:MAG: VOC family protein [Thermomicrobium sp.]
MVKTVNEVVRFVDRFGRFGWQIMAGVGRHGPGRNSFLSVRDPFGGRIEITADVARLPNRCEPPHSAVPRSSQFDDLRLYGWRGEFPTVLMCGGRRCHRRASAAGREFAEGEGDATGHLYRAWSDKCWGG